MTNAELAALLNQRLGLSGKDAVSINVIRQWVEWDVLPKATAKGQAIGTRPAWSRPDTAIRRALRLAELRTLDVKRETAVIVQAYIEWGHSDFDRVRDALLREWTKWTAQLRRDHITFLGKADYRELSAGKRNAIAKQIGPLDSRFNGTQFEQSPEFYATVAELARSGPENTAGAGDLIAVALERMMPGIGKSVPESCIAALANTFSGMTGTPDELGNLAAQSEIANASEREFRIARSMTRRAFRAPRQIKHLPAIQDSPSVLSAWLKMQIDLASQISVGPWAVSIFVQFLLAARRGDLSSEIKVNLENFADLSATLISGFDMPKA